MTLKRQIIEGIQTSGPIPFDRFMEIALYDPRGFFGGSTLRSEKAGDFLTSPEVSRLFGETLAVYVEQVRSELEEPFQLIEVGAGSGSLLRVLLESLAVDALAVEASPAARASIAGLVPVSEQLPLSMRGVVIANELLDNLPMALAQRVDGDWRERWVGIDGDDLVFVDAAPRPQVLDWLTSYSGPVDDGGWVEVQIAAREWLTDVLQRLDEGRILLFDYGDTADGLANRRRDGTLRTYRAHHLGPHPLDEPGETDITADVNFSAFLDLHPETKLTRQEEFLSELGLRDRLSGLRVAELAAIRSGDDMERLRLRTLKTEAETLLHPRGLGDFRVLEVVVHAEPPTGMGRPTDG